MIFVCRERIRVQNETGSAGCRKRPAAAIIRCHPAGWRAMLRFPKFFLMSTATIPTEHTEATNARILAVSEDLIAGFVRKPFHLIAEKSGVPFEVVLERI